MAFKNTLFSNGGDLAVTSIQSPNFVAGVSGWQINKDGTAEFSDAVLRGSLLVGNAGSAQVHIYSAAGVGVVDFPSGDPAEDIPAQVTERVVGTGGTRVLATQYASGRVAGSQRRAVLLMQSTTVDNVFDVERALFGTQIGNAGTILGWLSIANDEVNVLTPGFVIGGTDLLAAWTPYIVNWTGAGANPAIGNGTLNGAYRIVGKTVDFRIYLQAGSTTTYGSGLYSFNPPFPAKGGAPQSASGYINDISAASRWNISMSLIPTPRLLINSGSGVQSTVPFTFATGDEIVVTGTYEID